MTGLHHANLTDPDAIIRTSGEFRLSNFLLWQCAYTEFISIDKFWPDVTSIELIEILKQFANRQRRFGGTTTVINKSES